MCHSLARDQPQPGSFFQRPREAEKRDPGNEVAKNEYKHEMQFVKPYASDLHLASYKNRLVRQISDSAECYAGLLVHFESSPACI